MRSIKHLAFVFFLFVIVLIGYQPVMADVSCGGKSCYPPYGVSTQGHCYINQASTCSYAVDRCVTYCGEDGIEEINCSGTPADGVCYCGVVRECAPCMMHPDDCDPQTPLNTTTCQCQGSPLIVDVEGTGIQLTDVRSGVEFNFTGNGARRMAWTRGRVRSGFIVLDRNRDGVINDGRELFGTLTAQPPSDSPNGFAALGVFDESAQGGNRDSWVDRKDQIFSQLRIWIDDNHDGLSAPNELETLNQAGIKRIALRYDTANVTDEFGNSFRYRARVIDSIDQTRWVWDVFLNVAPRNTY
jgi:hypothetical protein